MKKFKTWLHETIKRLKKAQPKYFQRWFWVYIFTTLAGSATTINEVANVFPEATIIQTIGKYLMAIGIVGGFMSSLPNPDPPKEDDKKE